MRVLHVVGASEDNGGILSVLRNLQSATARQGVEHQVWVRPNYQEVRTPSLNYLRSRWLWSEHPQHFRLFFGGVLASFELIRLTSRERFDIIHAHSRGGFVVAGLLNRLFKRRVIFTNHAYARRVGMYRKATEWQGFQTTVLTPSMAAHYGISLPNPRVEVISECCGDEWFQFPLVRRKSAPNSCPVRFVGIGNILPWKKWDLVASALAEMTGFERSQCAVTIYGPVPNLPEAREYFDSVSHFVRQRGLLDCFEFKGPILDVASVIKESDVFLLPSTNEPCSVALIEALALGLPAIVSRSGGNPDLVQEKKSGFMFVPDSVEDLKRAMLDGVKAFQKDTFLSPESIRISVSNRSAVSVAEDYLKLYRKVYAPHECNA